MEGERAKTCRVRIATLLILLMHSKTFDLIFFLAKESQRHDTPLLHSARRPSKKGGFVEKGSVYSESFNIFFRQISLRLIEEIFLVLPKDHKDAENINIGGC